MRTKQPALGLLPVLILTVPDVSETLTEADPPTPSMPALMLRLGAGPVKLRWLGTCKLALPFITRRETVICEAVIAPLNDEAPDTLRLRMLVSPSMATLLATCRLFTWASPRLLSPEIVKLGP